VNTKLSKNISGGLYYTVPKNTHGTIANNCINLKDLKILLKERRTGFLKSPFVSHWRNANVNGWKVFYLP
jgi:hypothetical protein